MIIYYAAYPDCTRLFGNSAFFLVFGKRRTYASEDRLSIGNGINEPSHMPPAAGALYLASEKTCRNQPVPGNKKSPLFNEPINRKR